MKYSQFYILLATVWIAPVAPDGFNIVVSIAATAFSCYLMPRGE